MPGSSGFGPAPDIDGVTYWEFFDYDGVMEEYLATLDSFSIPYDRNDCSTDSTGEHPWNAADGSRGRLSCWVSDGTAYTMWTHEGSSIFAFAWSESGNELVLYEWWSNGNWDLGG